MDRRELLATAARGDADATEFLERVIGAFHTWDDLVDRDKQVADAEINAAFLTAFVWLPTSPFYAAHFNHLYPILANAITNWVAATDMERAPVSPLDTEIAFITRSEYINLIIEVARLCGGHDWAAEVAADVRRFSHAEGYAGYLENLKRETEARHGA